MRCDCAVSDATIAACVALDSAMKQRNGPTSLRAVSADEPGMGTRSPQTLSVEPVLEMKRAAKRRRRRKRCEMAATPLV